MMKNIGVLKNHIRHQILVQDKVEELVPLLSQLDRLSKNSLLPTCIKYDALECFKILHIDCCYRSDLIQFLPPKILLHLINDEELFFCICRHSREKKLADYFCKGYQLHVKVARLADAIMFHFAENPNPTKVILDLIDNNTIEDWQVKLVIRKETMIKPFCDKYEKVWNALSYESKETVDSKRCCKDDWNQLLNFPWKGFLDMPVYLFWELLQTVYPNNRFLFRGLKSVEYIERFQKSWRQGQIRHDDWKQLQFFPWDGFLNIPVYLLWDILKIVYPANYFLLQGVKSVLYIERFQKSWKRVRNM